MAVAGNQLARKRTGGPIHWIRLLGGAALKGIVFTGGMSILLGQMLKWIWQGLFRRNVKFSHHHLIQQMIRVGVRSIPIVLLVQFALGFILALQMAPELERWGQVEQVASINAIAGFRELGIPSFECHGIKREFYLFPLVKNLKNVIQEGKRPLRFNRPFTDLVSYWKERWALPRADRKPEWKNFTTGSYFKKVRRMLNQVQA